MASWIQSLFGGSGEITELPEDLQKIFVQAKRDRKALRDLLKRSEKAQQLLRDVSGPLAAVQASAEAMSQQITELQERVDTFADVSAQVNSVEQRAKELTESQSKSDTTLNDASRRVSDLKMQVRDIRSMVDEIVTAKDDLTEMAGPYGTVATLLKRVNVLREELQQMQDRGTGLKESVAQLDVVEKRIKGVSASQDELAGSLERSASSADKLEGQVTTLHAQVEAVADARTNIAELLGPSGTVATLLTQVSVLREELREMQDHGTGLKETVAQLDVVEKRIKGVSASQDELAGSLERSSSAADKLEGQVTTLDAQVEAVAGARTDMADLLGPSGTVAILLKRVNVIREEIQQMQDHGTGLKESFAQLDVVEKRIKGVSASQDELAGSLERSASSVDKLEGQVTSLHSQVDAAADARTAMAELLGPKGDLSVVRDDLEKLREELSRIEGRTLDLGQLEGRVAAIAQQADAVAENQRKALDAIQSASKEVKDLDSNVSDLREGVQSVSVARQEIAELSGPKGALSKLRTQVEEARAQFLDYSQDVARIREDQADTRSSQEALLSRYKELRTRMDAVDQGVEYATSRVASVENTMQDLTQAEELAGRTERQLNALRGLSDHVSQKTAALERQREAIDRTEAQARAFTDLHWELESKLKEARAQVKEVKKVNTSVEALRGLNAKVTEQFTELRAGQANIRREDEELRSMLAGLWEEVRHSTKSFELGRASLEAIDERIVDLRMGVTEFENRFRALDDASQRVSEATRRGDHLSARLTSLSSQLDQLSEQVELVTGMRDGMARAEASAVEAANRLERIEARQSEVSDAIRDLTTLRGSREEVVNAMERLRATRAEIERMQSGQLETGAWLATAQESIRELRQRITQLDDLTANLDHMRQNADRVLAAASHLEAREPSLTELDNRMSELREIGTQLDERTSNLLASLADADRRFEAVSVQAEAADKVRAVIEDVTAAVRKAEGHMEELGEGVDAAVERSEYITALSERVDRVAADIAQRQQALDKATEHLDRVATLRQETATALQALEDQLRSVTEHLVAAEEQSEKVGVRAERLEARAGSLRFAEKRITQFEEKLADLDKVEQELGRSIETLAARQGSIDQVRDEVQELFSRAERTLEDVRAISAATDEVQTASENLEVVRAKAEEMTEVLASIDERQRQIENAEGRLARADGLLMDIRAGLESLRSQKAVVDQVIVTSGQLTYEAKEAERLLVALRQERDLTQGIHDALKEMRDEDSDARAG